MIVTGALKPACACPRHWIDFTMPGAEAYHRFLTRELIPAVDATYRTDPARRIYSGHSLSGEFAMHAFYLERPGHAHYLVLASSLRGNAQRVAAVHERLAGRGFTSLRLRHVQYTQEHLEMDGPSFAEALGFLLEAPAR